MEDGKRSFTVVSVNDKRRGKGEKNAGGRYISRTAAGAARKAGSRICRNTAIRGQCTLTICIQETTRGSSNKFYHYKIKRVVNKDTVSHEGKTIKYKYNTFARKDKTATAEHNHSTPRVKIQKGHLLNQSSSETDLHSKIANAKFVLNSNEPLKIKAKFLRLNPSEKITDLRSKIANAKFVLNSNEPLKIKAKFLRLNQSSSETDSLGMKKGDLYWTDYGEVYIPHKTILKKLTAKQWKEFYDEYMIHSEYPHKNKEEIFAYLEKYPGIEFASLPTIKSSRLYLHKL